MHLQLRNVAALLYVLLTTNNSDFPYFRQGSNFSTLRFSKVKLTFGLPALSSAEAKVGLCQ